MTLNQFASVVVTPADARQPRQRIDFKDVADRARPYIRMLVERWLPDGNQEGNKWVARNPRRNDHTAGSFKVNLSTGAYFDFADHSIHGGDIIALGAYLHRRTQLDSAKGIARAMGLSCDE